MPAKPIDRSYAGSSLLVRIITAKFAEHTPHYRQSEIYRRQGVELSRATLGRWSGAASELLYDLLRQDMLMSGKMHTDDIPMLVQQPGSAKTRTARSTCDMTTMRGHSCHRRCGSHTRRTGKVFIRNSTLRDTAISRRQTHTVATTCCMKTAALRRRPARPICSGKSTMFTSEPQRISPLKC